MSVRVRMAPSPTGEFHIGSMRTFLYNWAFAKQKGGKLVLRIEDTDRTRYVPGSLERLLKVIKDYGLDWDEGPEVGGPHSPYVQSERLELYKKYAEDLIAKGKAYYCFCTEEDLLNMREKQKSMGLATTKYDKRCLGLSPEEIKEKLESGVPHVIRLNVPENEEISFYDYILGETSVNSNDIDDQILLKSDGFPTYHLGVVVDDHLMGITHIIRGVEWLPSTPKHILLYKYFGWEIPLIAHLPVLKEIGSNVKMSKRHGGVFAIDFLREGYLPEAVLNFLMFLGWNPGTEKEIYSLEEFVADFSLEKVHKTDLVSFDRQKLLWMNGYYIRQLTSSELWKKVKKWAIDFDVDLGIGEADDTYMIEITELIKERMKLLSEFPALISYFFIDPTVPTEELIAFGKGKTKDILKDFIDLYSNISVWDTSTLDQVSHEALETFGYSAKEAFMTIRIAVSGQKATPPLFEFLSKIDKETVLKRLRKSLETL